MWETTTFDVLEWRAEYLSWSPSHSISACSPFLVSPFRLCPCVGLRSWCLSQQFMWQERQRFSLFSTHTHFPNKMSLCCKEREGRFGAFQPGSTCLTSVWFSVSRRPTFWKDCVQAGIRERIYIVRFAEKILTLGHREKPAFDCWGTLSYLVWVIHFPLTGSFWESF